MRGRSLASTRLDHALAVTGARIDHADHRFSGVAAKAIGSLAYASASASSGLTVTFVSLTPTVCTVSGVSIGLIIAGKCTIRASQPGNSSYGPAADVDQSFDVALGPQSITFASLSGKTFGEPPFTVAAIASSRLVVAFASQTARVCSVSGNTVSLVGAGTCTLQAGQSGNASFAPAVGVNQSFIVAKASQTIAFTPPAPQMLGNAPVLLTATASSGLPVTLSALSSGCSVSGNTVTLLVAGSCTIQALQPGDANYSPAIGIVQSFYIAPTAQTIIFAAMGPKPLGVPVALAATASSGLPVSFSSSTPAICAVSGGNAILRALGTCSIQATQAGDVNHASAPPVTQSFTVTQGAQSIGFAALADHQLNSAPFVITATATSGQPVTFSSLSTPVCSVSGSVVTLLMDGTCTVSATQAGNASYAAAPAVERSFGVTGAAQFAAAAFYGVGNYPYAIASADFNADGKPDLAIVSSLSVTISLGTGDGTFTTAPNLTVGVAASSAATGDFNGDGKPDLVVTNILDSNLGIYLSRGDGTFEPRTTVPSGLAPMGVATGDFNGDGKLDVAITNGTSGSTTGQTVTVLLGNGDGTFGFPRTYPVGTSPSAIQAIDINGDGKLDLVVANADSNNVSVLIGTGDGNFRAAVSYGAHLRPRALALADLNRDGKLDLIVTNVDSNDVSVLLGRGDGTFAGATHYPAGGILSGIVLADFNGDGFVDVGVGRYFESAVAILQGNGDGSLRLPQLFGVGPYPIALLALDVNRDGRPDLVNANYLGNSISILLNTAMGNPPATISVAGGSAQSATVGNTYGTPLTALVKDVADQPMPGITISFTAPSAGASGTFPGGLTTVDVTTDGSGVAHAPTFSANSVVGSFFLTASSGALQASFSLNNVAAGQPPTITTRSIPDANLGTPYGATIVSSGTPAPTIALTSGSLPPGLSLNASTGVIAGTPITLGTYTGVLTASNGAPPPATMPFSITVAPSAQTIVFGTLQNRAFGSLPSILSASASSGLPVSFASLTPSVCSLQADTLVLLSAGVCAVRASQAGNSGFAAAANIDQGFTVTQGTQSIDFRVPNGMAWTSPPQRLSATASSGLPVSYASSTPAICEINGDFVAPKTVGSCTVRAAQPGNSNHLAATPVDRTFPAFRAQQNINFWSPGDQGRTSIPVPDRGYVAPPVPLSAAVSSGLPISFATQSPAVCTVSGNVVSVVTGGQCVILASQIGNELYEPTGPVEQRFLVNTLLSPPRLASPLPPFIEYATYLGGFASETAFDVAVGADGAAYVGGSVRSTNFPSLPSTRFTNGGLDLSFIARINPDAGRIDFATPIGGRAADVTQTGSSSYVGSDQVEAMTIDASGTIYVAAYANTFDFPQRGGTYVRNGPKRVYRVTATGVAEAASGVIDPAVQSIRALAVDSIGSMYITGRAGPDLRTSSGAALPVGGGPYLIKLGPHGDQIFATYLSTSGSRPNNASSAGQSHVDSTTTAYALTIDAGGNSYLAGQASASDFPASFGTVDTADDEHRDAFVAKVNAGGTALLFVARLGGLDAERATSIALSPDGDIVIGGKTATVNFVGTGNTFQNQVVFEPGRSDRDLETGFVAKLAADGRTWRFVAAIGTDGGSLLPSSATDASPVMVAVDSSGAIYAAGTGGGASLPVLTNIDGLSASRAFVMKMTSSADRLLYSTMIGAGTVTGLAVDAYGAAYVVGTANSFIPVVNAGQVGTSFGAFKSTPFVVKLSSGPVPIDFAIDAASATANQPIVLRATVGDARYAGSVEFRDGDRLLGSALLVLRFISPHTYSWASGTRGKE